MQTLERGRGSAGFGWTNQESEDSTGMACRIGAIGAQPRFQGKISILEVLNQSHPLNPRCSTLSYSTRQQF